MAKKKSASKKTASPKKKPAAKKAAVPKKPVEDIVIVDEDVNKEGQVVFTICRKGNQIAVVNTAEEVDSCILGMEGSFNVSDRRTIAH